MVAVILNHWSVNYHFRSEESKIGKSKVDIS